MNRRAACPVLLFVALAGPAAAETGADAFARHDFAVAADLWRDEAGSGSAEAKLGLGLLSDLGLGTPRDSAKAMRWYLEAADAGLPQAEFNVAVMMDAGTGAPRDTVAAAVWYARAAANGHARASYNLGLLYQAGDGVPRNADLARYWLKQAAATLPAAAERLAALAPAPAATRELAAPREVSGALVPGNEGDGYRAELVWSAPPAPEGDPFLVEMVRLPDRGDRWGTPIVSQEVEASAITLPVPAGSGPVAWRVSRVDPARTHYAASAWHVLGPSATALPEGRVTIHIGARDAPAAWLARELSDSFSKGGLWVRVVTDPSAPRESGVRFRFAEDAGLAETVAEFLPVLSSSDARLAPPLEAAPGEIVVRLVGGPAEPQSAAVAVEKR